MRRGFLPSGRPALLGLVAGSIVLVLADVPARGQIPQPVVPELTERSGLIRRFEPIQPNLPPDGRRDSFYDTRWDDKPWKRRFPNCYKAGGLYGLPWRADCSMSIYPFFYGSPGQSTLGPGCLPWWRPLRYVQTMVQQFRPGTPVGMYYDWGTYVPVYDLDPDVPGPGPYPIPWYYRGPRGG